MDKLNIFITNLANVVLNPLIRLMFAAATLYFIWGVFLYIKNSQSESERKKGAQHMLWGLIGITIMVGVYGILQMATNTFLSVAPNM